jgi:hypothetical protein
MVRRNIYKLKVIMYFLQELNRCPYKMLQELVFVSI